MFRLPDLPYSYDALEPYIDSRTMEIHHTKHHQAYVNNLNAVLEKYPDLQDKALEDLLKNLSSLKMEERNRTILKNHGGGHLNHFLFWQIMGPSKQVDGVLKAEIQKEFGSLEEFKKVFSQAAIAHFGSGWAWLVRDENQKLKVYSLPNQDSPYLQRHIPIIGLDMWEHAYYLKYQNRRNEYVEAWWNVVNWEVVERKFKGQSIR